MIMNTEKLKAVAEKILLILGRPITTMKLEKLVYYAQCWNLVWNEAPIYENEVEAWAHGPVIRDLYNLHKGNFIITSKFFEDANLNLLSHKEKDTIKRVVDFYGDKDPQWLSDLTHFEAPWKNARKRANLQDGERGNAVISREEIFNYYVNL